jgi:hypothetical protein
VEAAQGCIWDLRFEGGVVPLDLAGPVEGTVDPGAIREAFPGGWGTGEVGEAWPDQRLLSYLVQGVRFEVDLPLQIVLFPHLVSIPPGFASLQKETRRMALLDGGWMRLFPRLPYLPIRCLAHGAVSRKLEQDRWRSTTEAGGPRYELWDPSGVLVPAINALSKVSGYPPEVKPLPDQLAWDLGILNSAAR